MLVKNDRVEKQNLVASEYKLFVLYIKYLAKYIATFLVMVFRMMCY